MVALQAASQKSIEAAAAKERTERELAAMGEEFSPHLLECAANASMDPLPRELIPSTLLSHNEDNSGFASSYAMARDPSTMEEKREREETALATSQRLSHGRHSVETVTELKNEHRSRSNNDAIKAERHRKTTQRRD